MCNADKSLSKYLLVNIFSNIGESNTRYLCLGLVEATREGVQDVNLKNCRHSMTQWADSY